MARLITTWREFKKAVVNELIDDLFTINIPATEPSAPPNVVKLSQGMPKHQPSTRNFRDFVDMTNEAHLAEFHRYINMIPCDTYKDLPNRPTWFPYWRGCRVVYKPISLYDAALQSKFFWFACECRLSCQLVLFRNEHDTEFPRTFEIEPCYSETLRRFLIQHGVEEVRENDYLWEIFCS